MTQIAKPNNNYISVTTLDGVKVEVTFADAGRGPDGVGLSLNSSAAWYRPDGGEWHKSRERSSTKTCELIKNSNAGELKEKVGG